jgi:hypothetical protein
MFIHTNTFMHVWRRERESVCACVYVCIIHTYGAHTQLQAFKASHAARFFNYTGSWPSTFFLLFMTCGGHHSIQTARQGDAPSLLATHLFRVIILCNIIVQLDIEPGAISEEFQPLVGGCKTVIHCEV